MIEDEEFDMEGETMNLREATQLIIENCVDHSGQHESCLECAAWVAIDALRKVEGLNLRVAQLAQRVPIPIDDLMGRVEALCIAMVMLGAETAE